MTSDSLVRSGVAQDDLDRNSTLDVDSHHPNTVSDSRARSRLRRRILALVAVSALTWAIPVAGFVGDIAAGSRAVFVIVLPILIWVLLAAFEPPGGVVDGETNWIVAMLSCAAAAVVVMLCTQRIPTLTQLWRIDLLGPIVWTAAATAVLLGLRYALRLWDVWLLLILASPFPFLLLVGAGGGSDLATVAVSCCLAAVAVARSVRSCPAVWVAGAAVTSLVLGASTAWLLLAMPAPRGIGLIVGVAIGAGLIPLGVSYAVRSRTSRRAAVDNRSIAEFPATSRRGAIALIGLAAVVALLCPMPQMTATPSAASDWTDRSHLVPVRNFPAAAAVLGPNATFARYQPVEPSTPLAAVDVITAPTRGSLDDFERAQWYASDEPIDFVPSDLPGVDSVVVRSAHSHIDNDVHPDTPHWYLLTWTWRVPTGFQQVTVVVSQRDEAGLPLPIGLSAAELLIKPALWVARQQPRQTSEAETRTVEVAHELARRLILAANVGRGTRTDG